MFLLTQRLTPGWLLGLWFVCFNFLPGWLIYILMVQQVTQMWMAGDLAAWVLPLIFSPPWQ